MCLHRVDCFYDSSFPLQRPSILRRSWVFEIHIFLEFAMDASLLGMQFSKLGNGAIKLEALQTSMLKVSLGNAGTKRKRALWIGIFSRLKCPFGPAFWMSWMSCSIFFKLKCFLWRLEFNYHFKIFKNNPRHPPTQTSPISRHLHTFRNILRKFPNELGTGKIKTINGKISIKHKS